MAFATKYYTDFKDYYNRTITINIQTDGFAGTSTRLNSNGCNIRWEASSNNIYKPIRSSVATIGLYQTSYNQLDEFFDVTQKEYRVQIQVAGSDYWWGFLIAGDYQKPYKYAGAIQVRASDNLGMLSGLEYKNSGALYTGRDTAFNIINTCLLKTGFTLSFYEMVNVYENTMTSTTAYSPLKQVYIDRESFVDHFTHEALDCYDVIEKVLTPFNAVIFQESGVWNIIRIPDIKYESNYRNIYYGGGTVTGSGSEELYKSLSANDASDANYLRFINDDAIVKTTLPSASLSYEFPVKNNLLLDGSFENATAISDYYNESSMDSIGSLYTNTDGSKALRLEFKDNDYYLEYKTSYHATAGHNGSADQGFRVSGQWMIQLSSTVLGTGATTHPAWSPVIILDDGTTEWFWEGMMTDWVDYGVNWPLSPTSSEEPEHLQWRSFEFTFDGIKSTSSYEIKIRFPVFSTLDGSGGDSVEYMYFDDVKIEFIGGLLESSTTDVLDADNLYSDSEQSKEIFFRDSDVADTQLMVKNAMSLASEVRAYEWQSNNGSDVKTAYELAQDVFKIALIRPRIIYQGVLHGQFSYKNTLDDGEGRRCFPSNVSYDMDRCNWDGEWVEIKNGWGDNILVDGTDFTNGDGGAELYDTYDEGSAPTLGLVKSQTTTEATVTIEEFAVSGQRYLITITINDILSSDYPTFTWGGDTTQLVNGENKYEVLATASDKGYIISAIADTCDFTVDLSIQQAYGI